MVVQVSGKKKSCLELRSHFGGVSEENKNHDIRFQNVDMSIGCEIMKRRNEDTKKTKVNGHRIMKIM